jgi:hypothetical protein
MNPDPARAASPAVPAASPSRDPFVRNLVLLVMVSVAVSGWFLAYTDWFAEVSALLALGGLFTWIGVLSKLLTEKRTQQLQEWVEVAVFSSPTLTRRLVALAVAFVALASFTGTIEVQSQGDASDRLLWFAFDARSNEPADRLEPGGRVRAPWLTSWWSPAQVRVKVSGYPSLVTTVQPWRRTDLVSPGSFLMTPVILLVPTTELSQFSRETRLRVTVNGALAATLPFDGHPVWIGCEDDVRVPETIVTEWRTAGIVSEVLAAWQSPRAVSVDLHGGSAVTVAIDHDDGTQFVPPSVIKVRTPVRPEDFPQREIIDVPKH